MHPATSSVSRPLLASARVLLARPTPRAASHARHSAPAASRAWSAMRRVGAAPAAPLAAGTPRRAALFPRRAALFRAVKPSATRAVASAAASPPTRRLALPAATIVASASPRRGFRPPHPSSPRATVAADAEAAAASSSASSSSSAAASKYLGGALTWPSRTRGCGTLGEEDDGDVVQLCGWVDKQRDMGGIVFADVRDHTGLCQIVSDDRSPQEAVEALAAIRAEWVVCARGRVRRRVAPNPKMPTGAIEVAVDSVEVLNVVQRSLPFAVSESGGGGDADTTNNSDEIREEVRLKHRVLDLRRPQMVRNLRLRARTIGALRRVLEERHGFMEIETPMLTRSTPEGARDYLVPSRVQPGACYALPQSPQLFKQMLMVAGADRYYQVARCFRDEDLRADRQPEFTQLDLEMAFTDEDGVLDLGEDLLCAAFETGAGVTLKRPFPRMTYAEAMRRYGCDKPDTRYGLEMAELNDALAGSEFKLFSGAIESGGVVKAIAVPEGARLSNSRLKPKGDVFDEAVKGGAGGLAYARVVDDAGGEGGVFEGGKALCSALAERRDAVLEATGAKPGDLLLFGIGAESVANKSLDRVRQYVAKTLDMIPEGGDLAVLWITEFPMFQRNEEEDRLEALHHPFTAPNQEDVADGGDVRTARAIAYDLVVNGVEIGGGSLRIYRRDVQERVFEAIGLSEAEAEEKFGYLMEAFQFGAPPHGGMAFGLDRLVMMLAGAKSIRDVIAFPKTATAQCLLTSAPGDVSDAQLEELHVMKAPSVSTSGGGEEEEKKKKA